MKLPVLLYAALVVVALFSNVYPGEVTAAPIQKIQGIITEVGEGYLRLEPAQPGRPQNRRFILRWKAQFIPPKLPLKGDRVLLLYKDKEIGAVIYGVRYLPSKTAGLPEPGNSP